MAHHSIHPSHWDGGIKIPDLCHPTRALDPVPINLLQATSPTAVSEITCDQCFTGLRNISNRLVRHWWHLTKLSLDPAQVEDYRPVPSLPFLSKAIERAVFKQVSKFLSLKALLDPNQSATPLKRLRCLWQKTLRAARAAAQSSVLISLDLSAGFDMVNHHILLSMLSNMGIWGKVHSWFLILSCRPFNVSWQGQMFPIASPMGCSKAWLLGPLSFLYTSPPWFSLSTWVNCHITGRRL